MLPGRDTVTFIRLKMTGISMFIIRLSIKLHGGEVLSGLPQVRDVREVREKSGKS